MCSFYFKNIPVDSKFLDAYAELRATRDLHVVHGSVGRLSDVTRHLGARFGDSQPLILLYELAKMRHLRITDLFQKFDKDRNSTITRDELMQGLMVGI